MSKQLEAKPINISSPAQLLRVLNEEYSFTNDQVVVAVIESHGLFQPGAIHSIHENTVIDSGMPTNDFYEQIAEFLRDEEDTFAIVPVRGRDRSHVDPDVIEGIFADHQVLDVIQVDWTEKTWASDMCGDNNCCDQSMTQSFLLDSNKEEVVDAETDLSITDLLNDIQEKLKNISVIVK